MTCRVTPPRPPSNRNGGRFQVGTVAAFKSEYPAGFIGIRSLVGPVDEGTPQGGPLSPLLSNLVLDDLDKELIRRGHRFCRYADDCKISMFAAVAPPRH